MIHRLLLVLLLCIISGCATDSVGAAPEPAGAEGAGAAGAGGCDPECEDNLLCQNGECVFEPIPCGDEPSACPAPYECVEGYCKLPGGSQCRYASQCASMKCHLGVCVIEF